MARQAKRPAAAAPAAPTDFFIGRERLFARLDQLSGRAVWLQGPTGAGKTVLLRTYVRRSAEPVLWVAIDAKSTTPDALFNALAQAAQRAGVDDLPQFAGEHRQSPNEFMRLSAERIVQRLPGAIVVIDDAQRLLPALASLLQVLIDACCTDLRLLFAGQDLPLGLEPQIAASKVVVVGHEQLQFDEAETNELAKRVGAADTLAHAMRERTSGWAAGLMLALQLGQGATTANAQRRLEGPLASLVHGGVLAGVAPDTVRALAALAPARYIPAALAKLGAPWTQAVAELERLSERGLFVERQDNGDLRLHDLFCSALRQEPIDDEDRDAAVAALTEIDRCELALNCMIAASDCGSRLQEWLSQHGDLLLTRADIGTFAMSVLQCGADLSPEVLLWCARGAMATDLALADATAERAFVIETGRTDPFKRRCCGLGLLAAQVLLDADRIETWLTRLASLPAASDVDVQQAPLFEAGARLAERVLRPRLPSTEQVHSLHGLLKAALLQAQPPQEAVLAASLLVFSLIQLQRRQEAPALIAQMENAPWFSRIPPYALIEWLINSGDVLVSIGRIEEAISVFAKASFTARQQGMPLLLRTALVGVAKAQLSVGDVASAEQTIIEAGRAAENPGVHRRVDELCLLARVDLARGRAARALSDLETAEQLLSDAGAPATGQLERARVQVLFTMKQQDEAFDFARRCVESNEGAMRDSAQCDLELLTGIALRNTETEASEAALARGIAIVERRRWTNYLLLLPGEAGLVSCLALVKGIAGDVVRDAVRERRLPAPSGVGAEWPWPMRIFVLGNWRLERFDEVMEFHGKVQRKPLELLKFLACAREQSADHASVYHALWPDADESAARRSLEMATARLRDMLGNAGWVRVSGGRTCLDPGFVWSDAQALWCTCEMAEEFSRKHDLTVTCDAAEQILRLYRGDLLAGDDEAPWLLGARERLRSAFVRGVRAVSIALREGNRLDLAIALMERALTAEPLAEELAQRLMNAHLEAGQPAEAMRVYRSLRQALSVMLGRAPAAASEKLRQSIINQPHEGEQHEQQA